MSQDSSREGTGVKLDTGTRLAHDRTFLAHERTLMAWIRTALSLISFGFTIAKFFEFLHDKKGEAAPLLGAQTVGTLMIAIGVLGLAIATAQQTRELHKLRARCPGLPRPVSWLTAVVLTLVGVLALVGAIVRN